jgi:hypothetical protein
LQQGAFASLTGTGDVSSGFDDSNIYGGLLGDEAGEMNGGSGFGRSGSGGGTGWRAIATGRYGTIGRGSGTGHGYGIGGGRGGLHGRMSNVPTVSIGQPNAQGDLDKAIIRRYIKRNISKITYCYEKQLLVNPKLAGTVSTQFFITPNGDVASASGSGVDPKVSSCVADVIKAIVFPKPKGGGGVQVNYPFTFRPADDSATDVAATGSAAVPTPDSPPPPPAPPSPPPAPPTTPRQLFRDATGATPTDYKPDAHNPLGAQEAALAECMRKSTSPTHYGVFVVELTYDASGKATHADPHGLFDERARKCVVEAALKATHTGTAAERCSIAYGEMPVAALPALDVTADLLKLDGQAIPWPRQEMAHFPITQVPAITDAIEKRRKQAIAAGAPVVSLHGPLVVKPADATPMKDVWAVLASVLAGGDDLVLATAEGKTWTLIEPMTLPVVPVPLATGGRWSHIKIGHGNPFFASEDENVKLSILVTKDKLWLGLSRLNEFQAVARDASFDATLTKLLQEHKKGAFFVDRDDVELAGEDDVTYADIVRVIRAAKAAGFTSWQLTDPKHLAARPQD